VLLPTTTTTHILNLFLEIEKEETDQTGQKPASFSRHLLLLSKLSAHTTDGILVDFLTCLYTLALAKKEELLRVTPPLTPLHLSFLSLRLYFFFLSLFFIPRTWSVSLLSVACYSAEQRTQGNPCPSVRPSISNFRELEP
jgi:hypothetical protein